MPEPRKAVWWRYLLGSLLVVLLTTGAISAAALLEVKQVSRALAQSPRIEAAKFLTPDQAGAPQTIMVIGSDRRYAGTDASTSGRTDTIMLIRMDPNKGQTSILSIPRDLLVNFTIKGATYTDQKVNAAYTYGGPQGAVQVVKATLDGIQINHVVDVNFKSFYSVIKAIGCVYVDVDHTYFNRNIGTVATDYANIDLKPGYQKLCGYPALDYVRYRHTDSDFVRVARQQDFIRAVKEQVGVSGLLDNFGNITKAVGKSIETDFRGTTDTLRLLKLAAFSLSKPIRQVQFQADPLDIIDGEDFVSATPEQITATVNDFLHGNQHAQVKTAFHAEGALRKHKNFASIGLYPLVSTDREAADTMAEHAHVKVELPTLKTGNGVLTDEHTYDVRDEQGKVHRGYRIDWRTDAVGSYYGIEGMNWTDPPLFGNASTQTIGGITYLLVNDGSHIHDVGWRRGGMLYWISNTELEGLTNAQMLSLARSASVLHVSTGHHSRARTADGSDGTSGGPDQTSVGSGSGSTTVGSGSGSTAATPDE
ncbi:MAG TPA: LCP family protein [Solirubrobacteraceae bacterium]|nr:LCP family protein [Solirubrobacteraceae bacterium]